MGVGLWLRGCIVVTRETSTYHRNRLRQLKSEVQKERDSDVGDEERDTRACRPLAVPTKYASVEFSCDGTRVMLGYRSKIGADRILSTLFLLAIQESHDERNTTCGEQI